MVFASWEGRQGRECLQKGKRQTPWCLNFSSSPSHCFLALRLGEVAHLPSPSSSGPAPFSCLPQDQRQRERTHLNVLPGSSPLRPTIKHTRRRPPLQQENSFHTVRLFKGERPPHGSPAQPEAPSRLRPASPAAQKKHGLLHTCAD